MLSWILAAVWNGTPWLGAPEDLGVDGEARAGVDGAEAGLRGLRGVRRVVPRRVDGAAAALVECVEVAVDLLGCVVFGHLVLGRIPDLLMVSEYRGRQ